MPKALQAATPRCPATSGGWAPPSHTTRPTVREATAHDRGDAVEHLPGLAEAGLTLRRGGRGLTRTSSAEVLAYAPNWGDRTGTGTRSVFARQLRYDPDLRLPPRHHQVRGHEGRQGDCCGSSRGPGARAGWPSRGSPSGTSGRTTASSGRSTASSGGPGPAVRGRHRPDSRAHQHPAHRPRLPAHAGQRLERLRPGPYGAGPLPRPLPVLVVRGRLSLQVYQRSADLFLGVPSISPHALLTHMLAQQSGLEVGEPSGPAGTATSTTTTSSRSACSSRAPGLPLPSPAPGAAPSIDAYTMDDIDASEATATTPPSPPPWRCEPWSSPTPGPSRSLRPRPVPPPRLPGARGVPVLPPAAPIPGACPGGHGLGPGPRWGSWGRRRACWRVPADSATSRP